MDKQTKHYLHFATEGHLWPTLSGRTSGPLMIHQWLSLGGPPFNVTHLLAMNDADSGHGVADWRCVIWKVIGIVNDSVFWKILSYDASWIEIYGVGAIPLPGSFHCRWQLLKFAD